MGTVKITKAVVSEALMLLGDNGSKWIKNKLADGKPATANKGRDTACFCTTGALSRAARATFYKSGKGWYTTHKYDANSVKIMNEALKSVRAYDPADPKSVAEYTIKNRLTSVSQLPTNVAFSSVEAFNDNPTTTFAQVRAYLLKLRELAPAS